MKNSKNVDVGAVAVAVVEEGLDNPKTLRNGKNYRSYSWNLNSMKKEKEMK